MRQNGFLMTDFIWLEPSKAACVGLAYDWGGHYPYPLVAKRIKHPDLPGTRWMSRTKKGTGESFYSRSTRTNHSHADCYLLPTQAQWDARQQRLGAAV